MFAWHRIALFGAMFFALLPPTLAATARTTPLTATLTSHNAATWQQSDGWSNGAPFQVGWRTDHIGFAGGLMTLSLDNRPACSSASAACSNQLYAAGEYKSISFIQYGRLTFRAKPAAGSGVITGLFTYTGPSDGQQHDEIDIEFLGKDTTRIQFNYFVAGIGLHEKLVNLGFDASLAFHDYTIEWLPSAINWYVDGALKHSVLAGGGVTLPLSPQHIFMNIWAATGVNAWSGAFTYTGVPFTTQVDQVSYVPATGASSSLDTTGGGCSINNTAEFDPTMLMMLLLSLGYVIKKRRRNYSAPIIKVGCFPSNSIRSA